MTNVHALLLFVAARLRIGRHERKERHLAVFDYRLFYPDHSINDDRRARAQAMRDDRRIFQLPARRTGRLGARR